MLFKFFPYFMCFFCIFISVFAKPNILFIVIDDLRPALKVYGDENSHTPNIDQLASRSYIFTKAYAQQSLCAPSRNSFLTSRRPDTLHLYDFYSYWREKVGNFTTLPQFFKENGYFTKSIGKIFHPGISSNFTDDYPYSWSEKPFHPSTEKYENAKVCVSPNGMLAKNLICPVIVEEQPDAILPDQETLNEALRFLEKQENKSQSYFLAVGFHKPHIPFKFPIEYLKYHPLNKIKVPKNLFRPPLLPVVAWNPWNDLRKRDDVQNINISYPFGRIPHEMNLKIIQSYYSSLTYVDDLIGKLLSKVKEYENTIIVLLGDHGWSMGEHGEFAKYSNFELAVRVPLIITVPKLNQLQIKINGLTELVDIFPTLVDLAGFKKLKICPKGTITKLCTEGESLVPLMSRPKNEGRKAIFYQYPRPGLFPTLHPNSDEPKLSEIKIMGYSVITKHFRFTLWVKFDNKKNRPNWKKIYATELYDHLFDPGENNNLAGRGLKLLENKLKKMLINGWRNQKSNMYFQIQKIHHSRVNFKFY